MNGTNTWLKLSTLCRSNRAITDTMKQLKLSVTRMICVGFGPYKLSMVPPSIGWIELKLANAVEVKFFQENAKSLGVGVGFGGDKAGKGKGKGKGKGSHGETALESISEESDEKEL